MFAAFRPITQPKDQEIPLAPVGEDAWVYLEEDDDELPSLPTVEKPSAQNGVSKTFKIAELSSSGLNILLAEQMCAPETKDHLIETGVLKFKKDNKGHARSLKYYIIEKDYPINEKYEAKPIKKRLVFFDVTKDAETEENQPPLYHIGQLIQAKEKADSIERIPEIKENKTTLKFLEREKLNKSIFIMPMQQCRGLFSLPPEYAAKAHVVLVIYYNETNELTVFDSQGGIPILASLVDWNINLPLPEFVYPDKFKEKVGYEYKGIVSLGIQKWPHLCGYFVNTLRACFLRDGNADNFSKINLSSDLIILKENYMENHLSITTAILKKTKGTPITDPKDDVIEIKADFETLNKSLGIAAPTFFSQIKTEDLIKPGKAIVIKSATLTKA